MWLGYGLFVVCYGFGMLVDSFLSFWVQSRTVLGLLGKTEFCVCFVNVLIVFLVAFVGGEVMGGLCTPQGAGDWG